jgi:adenylate cyclase class 2
MSSSVRWSKAPQFRVQKKSCRAALDWTDEDICLYVVRAEVRRPNMPNEVEIKFRVDDVRGLKQRLRASGFREETRRTHESNTLYDLPGRALLKKGELLRLRKYGTSWLLTYKAKGKIARHKTRLEIQTRIDDGKQFEKILQALGYVPSFLYEKFRAEWSDGKGHVVLDETPIGFFGEIEGPARWIDSTARRLEIDRESYLTDSYAGLFHAWKLRTRSQAKDMTFRAVRGSKHSRNFPGTT